MTINGYGTFYGCESLHTVNLENNVNVENATNTFYLCSKLTTVTGANTLETIPQGMFSDCSSLQYIDISGAKSIGNSAFAGCNKLEYIRVSAKLTSIEGSSAFKAVTSDGKLVPMELTVHCTDSKEEANAQLEDWFKDRDICGETDGYPKFEYNCDDDCWSKIVNENQAGSQDAGNALAQYLFDLRL